MIQNCLSQDNGATLGIIDAPVEFDSFKYMPDNWDFAKIWILKSNRVN